MWVFVSYVLLLRVLPCPQWGPVIMPRPPWYAVNALQQRTAGSPSWLLRLKTATTISFIPSNFKPYPDVVWIESYCSLKLSCSSTQEWKRYIWHLSAGKRNDMAGLVQSIVCVWIVTHFCCFGSCSAHWAWDENNHDEVKVVTLKGNLTHFTQSVFTGIGQYYCNTNF